MSANMKIYPEGALTQFSQEGFEALLFGLVVGPRRYLGYGRWEYIDTRGKDPYHKLPNWLDR